MLTGGASRECAEEQGKRNVCVFMFVFLYEQGCVRTRVLRVCMYGTDGKTSQGLLCNWKRREVVIAF